MFASEAKLSFTAQTPRAPRAIKIKLRRHCVTIRRERDERWSLLTRIVVLILFCGFLTAQILTAQIKRPERRNALNAQVTKLRQVLQGSASLWSGMTSHKSAGMLQFLAA
jgi:hypothetical protein